VVNVTMMTSAQQDGELIADLAVKGVALRKVKMVRVGPSSAADEARVAGDNCDTLADC
jgi:hypothetical protein